jgi:hypothetical protein
MLFIEDFKFNYESICIALVENFIRIAIYKKNPLNVVSNHFN